MENNSDTRLFEVFYDTETERYYIYAPKGCVLVDGKEVDISGVDSNGNVELQFSTLPTAVYGHLNKNENDEYTVSFNGSETAGDSKADFKVVSFGADEFDGKQCQFFSSGVTLSDKQVDVDKRSIDEDGEGGTVELLDFQGTSADKTDSLVAAMFGSGDNNDVVERQNVAATEKDPKHNEVRYRKVGKVYTPDYSAVSLTEDEDGNVVLDCVYEADSGFTTAGSKSIERRQFGVNPKFFALYNFSKVSSTDPSILRDMTFSMNANQIAQYLAGEAVTVNGVFNNTETSSVVIGKPPGVDESQNLSEVDYCHLKITFPKLIRGDSDQSGTGVVTVLKSVELKTDSSGKAYYQLYGWDSVDGTDKKRIPTGDVYRNIANGTAESAEPSDKVPDCVLVRTSNGELVYRPIYIKGSWSQEQIEEFAKEAAESAVSENALTKDGNYEHNAVEQIGDSAGRQAITLSPNGRTLTGSWTVQSGNFTINTDGTLTIGNTTLTEDQLAKLIAMIPD